MKGIKLAGLLALLLSGFSGLGFYCQPRGEKVIRVAYQPFWVGEANIVLAMKHLRVLEQKGYKVVYRKFLSGPGVNEALASGSADIGFAGDMPTVIALASGMQVKVLGVVGKSLRQAIVVGKDKDIRTVSDLRGKKVAVAKGSTSHYFLYQTLFSHGIKPEQVDLIHLTVKAQPQALITGAIDAVSTWEPWPSKLVHKGIGRIIFEGQFAGYVYGREDFISRNREAVKDFMLALRQARDYASRHSMETCRWVSQETGDEPELICKAMATDRIFEPGENLLPSSHLLDDLEQLARFALEQGLIDREPNIRQKLDFSFLEGESSDSSGKSQ